MVLAAGLTLLDTALADSYPSRPVRIIAHGIAGSPTDTVSRVISQGLSELWGRQFVVENRPGAGGTIAVQLASRATPDGYTLVTTGDGPMAISPALRRKLPYDPMKDFESVAFGGFNEYVLVTHSSLPVKTVADIVALAKSRPGKLRYGSAGVGITNHLGMELFKQKAGFDIIHVPYKGGPAALTELVGQQIEFVMAGMLPSMPLIKSGRLRPIAVAGGKRSNTMPELPTIAETVPGVEVQTWGAFFAQAGTPKALLDKLNVEITRYLTRSDVTERLSQSGYVVQGMGRDELTHFLRSEIGKYAELVKTLGITATD